MSEGHTDGWVRREYGARRDFRHLVVGIWGAVMPGMCRRPGHLGTSWRHLGTSACKSMSSDLVTHRGPSSVTDESVTAIPALGALSVVEIARWTKRVVVWMTARPIHVWTCWRSDS